MRKAYMGSAGGDTVRFQGSIGFRGEVVEKRTSAQENLKTPKASKKGGLPGEKRMAPYHSDATRNVVNHGPTNARS